MHHSPYLEIADALANAKKISVLTGAGISTASGLSDFRSNGGLWDGKDPYEISNPSQIGTDAFRRFFADRIREFDAHEPNYAHHAIRHWSIVLNADVEVITQNIDGYHHAPGMLEPIELHGHVRHLECVDCGNLQTTGAYVTHDSDKCMKCLGTLRPPVVLFGENLDPVKWGQATNAVLMSDVLVVIGTSLEVAPFNGLVDIALGMRRPVILITKSDTPYDDKVSFRLRGDIVEEMTKINDILFSGTFDGYMQD